MEREAELLKAVIAARDDVAPRIAYGELLAGRGDPRGEMILAHCTYNRRSLSPEERRALKKRFRELLGKHLGQWWLGQRQPGWGGSGTRFEDWLENRCFSSGFQEQVRLSPDELLRDGPGIFAQTPVRTLVLSLDCSKGASSALTSLAKALTSALLAQVEALQLYYHPPVGKAGTALLAECPHLKTTKELSLVECALDDEAMALLGQSRNLSGLSVLELSQNAIGDHGVSHLLAGGFAPRLLTLKLQGCKISDQGATAIAGSRTMPQLRELWLVSNRVSSSGARALITSEHLPRLKRINLTGNPIRGPLPTRRGLSVSFHSA